MLNYEYINRILKKSIKKYNYFNIKSKLKFLQSLRFGDASMIAI